MTVILNMLSTFIEGSVPYRINNLVDKNLLETVSYMKQIPFTMLYDPRIYRAPSNHVER